MSVTVFDTKLCSQLLSSCQALQAWTNALTVPDIYKPMKSLKKGGREGVGWGGGGGGGGR